MVLTVVVVVLVLVLVVVVVLVVVTQVGRSPEVHAAGWNTLLAEHGVLLQYYADTMQSWVNGVARYSGDNFMDLEHTWAWSEVRKANQKGAVWRPVGLPRRAVETTGATSSEDAGVELLQAEYRFLGARGVIEEVSEDGDDADDA